MIFKGYRNHKTGSDQWSDWLTGEYQLLLRKVQETPVLKYEGLSLLKIYKCMLLW